MSVDRRELILAQLFLVVQGLQSTPVISNVYRNKTKLSEYRRPAIAILDADEEGAVGDFALGRPVFAPSIIHLDPEIWVMLGGSAATIGSDLNAVRRAVIAAVLSDQVLIDLCSAGGIQYQGCVTDLGIGRIMAGEMLIKISFHYALTRNEIS